jgi:hypothetical protein
LKEIRKRSFCEHVNDFIKETWILESITHRTCSSFTRQKPDSLSGKADKERFEAFLSKECHQ